jgi:hypothetical protein
MLCGLLRRVRLVPGIVDDLDRGGVWMLNHVEVDELARARTAEVFLVEAEVVAGGLSEEADYSGWPPRIDRRRWWSLGAIILAQRVSKHKSKVAIVVTG